MTNLLMSTLTTAWLDETTFANLGTVAFVLMMICALLGIIYFVRGFAGHDREEAVTPPIEPITPPIEPETPVPETPAADDGALIAVLTAAVAAVLADEAAAAGTPVPSFRVVSFRRSSRGRSWNA